MTEADAPAFAELVARAYAYARAEATPFVIDVLWEGLKGYELDDIRLAFTRHASHPERGGFAPMVHDVERELKGSTQDRAALAWAKAHRAARYVGAYRDVAFDDVCIHLAIEAIGGWVAFCQKPEAEIDFTSRAFMTAYRAARSRGMPQEWPRLSGLANLHNAPRGLPLEPVALVGDQRKAAIAWERGGVPAVGLVQIGQRAPALEAPVRAG